MSVLKKQISTQKIKVMLPVEPAAITLIFDDVGVSSNSFKAVKTKMAEDFSSVLCVISPKRSAMIKYMEATKSYKSLFVESVSELTKNKIIVVCLRDSSELSKVISVFEDIKEYSFLNAGNVVSEDIYLDEGLTGTRPNSYTKALEKFGPIGSEKGIVVIKKPILLAKAGSTIDRLVEGILKFFGLCAKAKMYLLKGVVYDSGSVVAKNVLTYFQPSRIMSEFRTNISFVGALIDRTPMVTNTKLLKTMRINIIVCNRMMTMINTKNKP
jgi:hypothetical protein